MPTFVIRNGVRRAKVSEALGRDRIVAIVYNQSGARVETRELDLVDLLSPKDVLDLTIAVEWIRYRRLESLLLAGVVLDPIEVVAGNSGIPISQVQVLT